MLTMALGIAGLITFYVIVRRMIERNSARLREEFRLAMDSLAARLEAGGTIAGQPSTPVSEPLPEIVGAIAAATAALGARKVQIRPAKAQPARAGEDIWAQHGRAGVWTSHDIAQRWR
jgi:hypothetical protein